MDFGYIKTVLSHAAAVHGVPLSTEPLDLARIALKRLGLIGKGKERDRRPTQDELDRIIPALDENPRQSIPVYMPPLTNVRFEGALLTDGSGAGSRLACLGCRCADSRRSAADPIVVDRVI